MTLPDLSKIWSWTTVKKQALKTSIYSMGGKVFGLLVPIFIAAKFGTSDETDAFFLAYVLSFFIVNLAGNIYETVLVPFVAEVRYANKNVGAFIGEVLKRGTFYLVMILAALLIILKWVDSLLPHLAPETFSLTFRLILELVPVIFFTVWTSTLNGALNSYQSFSLPALSTGIRSLTVIVFIMLLSERLGIHAITVGFVAGAALRLSASWILFRKRIGVISLGRDIEPHVKSFYKSMLPQSIGLMFISFLTVIDQSMASWVGPGGISLYAYGDRLYIIPYLLISSGVATVVFSHWSNAAKDQTQGLVWEKVRNTMFRISLLALALTVGFVFISYPMTKLFFGRGAFPDAQLQTVAVLFQILVIGLPMQIINLLCVRLLIIHRQNRFYMTVAIVRLILDVIFNYFLLQWIGIYGIAMSTTILHVISAVILYVYVKNSFMKKREKNR